MANFVVQRKTLQRNVKELSLGTGGSRNNLGGPKRRPERPVTLDDPIINFY